ncbi:MAG: hypothetical protein P8124_05985 [Gammaproteobacteria bacterium]
MAVTRPLLLAALVALASTTLVHADVLSLGKAVKEAPPNKPSGLLRPTNAMTMQEVAKKFGPPQKKLPAVGKPPITRWVYPRYTVYFENNLVIYSVVHFKTLK